MDCRQSTVAVIGLGALGLVALKNLAEEGFDVTGFERNGYVGGLWQYSDEDRTSVLESTVINVSKERGCFTDFPFPIGRATYCSGAAVGAYLTDYCNHFRLSNRVRLNTGVERVSRDEERQQWIVHVQGGEQEWFDKVIIATGINTLLNVPQTPGIERFKGICIHSRAFKRPAEFKGKRVLVVGLGNSGADTATQLIGHADQIYVAHRHGLTILPRVVDDKSIDHALTLRIVSVIDTLNERLPTVGEAMLNKFAKRLQDKSFNLRPEWGFSPAPSLKHAIPVISDNLVDALESGAIRSVTGLREVTGAGEVELLDGTRLNIDCIIFCTGYRPNYSIVEGFNPTTKTTTNWANAPGSNGKPLARLYRNIFSLEHPESLAFMGGVAFASPAFQLYDLASMAVAQVWKGTSTLPPKEAMEKAVNEHHAWICELAKNGPVIPGLVKAGDWMRWVNDAAGTGVNEYLGYGLNGWSFWLTNRRLCNMLMGGIYSPHIYRVFEGKRKKWDGATTEIERVNRAVKEGKVKL